MRQIVNAVLPPEVVTFRGVDDRDIRFSNCLQITVILYTDPAMIVVMKIVTDFPHLGA